MYSQSSFKIVIPTRDSARWTGQFLNAYRAVGIEPLYIVDSRSRDETETILREAGADIRFFEPHADFVESGMLAFASQMVSEDWIFRIDDDEFPSLDALRWAQEVGCRSNLTAWNFSRRELLSRDDEIVYCRLWSRFYTQSDPGYLNAQLRLYRHKEVEYCEEIHTPGFNLEENIGFAPQDAYFIHCDVLLRDMGERLDKLRRYERQRPGSSWKFAYNCLPELLFSNEHPTTPIGTHEFDGLLASLPKPEMALQAALTPDERRIVQYSTAELRQSLETGPRRARMMESKLTIRPIAWIVCALATVLKPLDYAFTKRRAFTSRLHQLGTDLWYCADVKRSQRRLTWHRSVLASLQTYFGKLVEHWSIDRGFKLDLLKRAAQFALHMQTGQ